MFEVKLDFSIWNSISLLQYSAAMHTNTMSCILSSLQCQVACLVTVLVIVVHVQCSNVVNSTLHVCSLKILVLFSATVFEFGNIFIWLSMIVRDQFICCILYLYVYSIEYCLRCKLYYFHHGNLAKLLYFAPRLPFSSKALYSRSPCPEWTGDPFSIVHPLWPNPPGHERRKDIDR